MSNIIYQLKGKELEVFEFDFIVADENTIEIEIISAPFKHYFMQVFNPEGEYTALFTFKTRLKKWTISSIPSICSSGCKSTEKMKGVWTFKIVSMDCNVGNIELKLTASKQENLKYDTLKLDTFKKNHNKRMYKGDLHLHSNISDGRVTLDQIYDYFLKSDLDFYILADHSILNTSEKYNFLVTGTEITWDDEGHYNAHGEMSILDLDYANYAVQYKTKIEALSAILRDLKDKGMVLTLNHPFRKSIKCSHDLDIQLFDCIEVINAPHLLKEEIDNDKAASFFDYLWNNGHYVSAVGGSDSHKENFYASYPIGIPTTHLMCDGLLSKNIIESMKKGHGYVTCFNKVEISANFEKKEIYFGAQIEGVVNILARSEVNAKWCVIKNGICISEVYGYRFEAKINIKENEFYRVEAFNDMNQKILFTNPLHNMKLVAKENRLLNLLKEFEETI